MIDKIIGQLLEEEPEDYKSDWFEPGIQILQGNSKEAKWVYHKDRTWEINTQAKNQRTLIIPTPRRPIGLLHVEPVVPVLEAFYEIIKGIMESLPQFEELVFVLDVGYPREVMEAAIRQLSAEGWLQVTRGSGQAVYAKVLHRNQRFESEGDMELDIRDLLRVHQEPLDYAAPSYLHDPEGNRLRKSRNLRGIRTYVSRFPVTKVQIWQRDRGEGVITITFRDGAYWTDRFADFGMLKQVLRTWRNLYGAELEIENEPAGKVGYRNPKLMEAYDDEAFDSAEAKEIGAEAATVYSLDQIKAAEPEFFSRENTRFFGTKKIYQYGNYIVLKNRRRSRGYFGNVSDYTSYVIYHFIMTHDRPNGLLLHKASTGSLADAKEMIKKNDFRSRRERVADELEKWKAQRAQQNPQQEALDDDDQDFKEVYQPDPWRYEVQPEKIHYKPWRLRIFHHGHSVGSDFFNDPKKAAQHGEDVIAAANQLHAVEPYSPDSGDPNSWTWSYPHVWAWLELHNRLPEIEDEY